jgi:AraC family transcriptional regulator, transcriptional activator of pobA
MFMEPIFWEEYLKPLQNLIMQPIVFNDLSITLMDAIPALHDREWSMETHRHPWFEFNYVSEGAAYTKVEDNEFLTSAGQSYLIPPGTFHSHRNCDHQGDNGFCLRWQLEKVEVMKESLNVCQSAADIIKILSSHKPMCINGNADVLIDWVNKPKSLAATQSVFIHWLMSLYEICGGQDLFGAYNNDHEKILVQQAIVYLTEYYAHDFSVKDLANSLNISYRHLARIFKHITGVTIVQKLNDIRINEAKKLLKETDRTIREIAMVVGFQNEYYFTTIFSQNSYITPSKFRSKFKE